MRLYAELLAAHNARVTELLAANNREVERRRKAEQLLARCIEVGAIVLPSADIADFETWAEVMHEASIKCFVQGGPANMKTGNLLGEIALHVDGLCKKYREETQGLMRRLPPMVRPDQKTETTSE